ncbi:MAG: argininosuccinate lyase [Gammaproteobacteria bacterium]|nr:argininosuccinate lyase [Gammaproteobacteria bacterium]
MKLNLKALFAAFCVLLFAQTVSAGQQNFELVNQTGVEIHRVYISPNGSDDWEEDVLDADTLPAGDSIDVLFDRSEVVALWDIRVEDSEGNALEWHEINLLKAHTVVLQTDGIARIYQ